MPRSVFLGFFFLFFLGGGGGLWCKSGCAGCDAVSPPGWLHSGRTRWSPPQGVTPGVRCCSLAAGGSRPHRTPWDGGWILPSVAHGNGSNAGLLPPPCAHCNDFGLPWSATSLLGAEDTVQPCCHRSPVPRGSAVSHRGDRFCAKATWMLCPPGVKSRTQPMSLQDLCWASFSPLLPFLLLRNSGQGCTGRLANAALPFRGLIIPPSLPLPAPLRGQRRWWLSPSPVSPRGPMVMGWFVAAKSSWEAGPCCSCVPFPALGTHLNYT